MRMIIGGRAQGKHTFACEVLKVPPERIIDTVASLVREAFENGEDAMTKVLALAAQDSVFICDEIGCGLVPTERAEREFRDEYGKICCALASRADEVWRVFCGIGTRIK